MRKVAAIALLLLGASPRQDPAGHPREGQSLPPWLLNSPAAVITPPVTLLSGWTDVPANECKSTPITASNGSVLSVSRAASKYCTDGNGVLHLLGPNVAALEPNGVLVEQNGANSLSQTQTLATSPWATAAGVVTAPTVTNNSTDVGDPTVLAAHTASKIVFPAVTGTNAFSTVAQSFTATAVPWAGSVYLRTASGSATVYLTFNGASYQTQACAVTTTWSRCAAKLKTLTAATWNFQLGVDLRDGSEATQSAQTIYAWGTQAEIDFVSQGSEHIQDFAPTSYMPGTSSPGTRDGDFLSITNPLASGPLAWSIAFTIVSPTATPGGLQPGLEGDNIDGNFADWGLDWEDSAGGAFVFFLNDPTGAECREAISSTPMAANTPFRVIGRDTGSLATVVVNGTPTSNPGLNGCTYVGAAYQQPVVYLGTIGPDQGDAPVGRAWYRDGCWATPDTGCT